MKKILAMILALFMMTAGAAVLAEGSEAEVQKGVYQITNSTGETVVSISITDNVTGNKVGADLQLAPEQETELGITIPKGEDGNHRLTLAFETESGKKGEFRTLSVEEAYIALLDVDTVAGATPIMFSPARQMGHYVIVNKTGAVVTSLRITDNVSGDMMKAETALAPDGQTELGFSIPKDEDGSHRLTFAYTVENEKEERVFGTLSIEDATINLLAQDAMTGATPIQFGAYPEKK